MAASQSLNAQAIGYIPPNPQGAGTRQLNSATTAIAFGFVLDQPATLSKFKAYLAAITGGMVAANYFLDIFNDAGAATGVPAPGTSLTGGTGAVLSVTPTAPNWVEWTGLNAITGLTGNLAADTQFWAVIKNLNASQSTVFPTFQYLFGAGNVVSSGFNSSLGWLKAETTDGTNWGTYAASPGCCRLGFADGSYAGLPLSNQTTSADQAFTTNEWGVKFTSPSNAILNVKGLAFFVQRAGTPTGNMRYRIYFGNSLTPTLTGTTNPCSPLNDVRTALGCWVRLSFPTPIQIPAGTTVRITVGVTTGGSSGNSYRDLAEATIENDANSKTLLNMFGQPITKTATLDGVTFTDTDTAIHPFALLLDSNGEFTATGSGGFRRIELGGGF